MKKEMRELSHYISIVKQDYPFAIPVTIVNAATEAIVPYLQLILSAKVLDFLLEKQFRQAVMTAAWMIGLTLILNLVRKITESQRNIYALTLNDSVRRQLNDKAYTMEYDCFERTESMDRIRGAWNFVNGSGGFGDQLNALKKLISSACRSLFSILLIIHLLVSIREAIRMDDILLWLLLLGLVATLVLSWVLSRISARMFEEAEKENVHINSIGAYIVDGIGMNTRMKKDMMLFPMRDLLVHYYDYSCSGIDIYLNVSKKDARIEWILTIFMNMYAALAYIFVGLKAIGGWIPVGSVLMYAGAIQRLTGGLQEFLKAYNDFVFRQSYLDPFYQFIHEPPMHYTGTLPIEKRTDADYELEFRDVSFAYPGTTEAVLQHVNLKFVVGQKLALVGRNGAGKSTLIKLLCRLYEPTSGEILLNGISIWKYDYGEYTSIFAPVFQDFKLFSLPVMENITCEAAEEDPDIPWIQRAFMNIIKKTPAHGKSRETGSDTAERVKVEEALAKAGILDRIRELPEGVHTQLYHDNGPGVDISGGEAQKLAIARAWYKDAPFVILDEPTAALDPLSEAEIYENFNDLIRDKTAIYISHRMSSCKFCDRIVVLKDGMILEEGAHEELLQQAGEYAELYNAQAQYYA